MKEYIERAAALNALKIARGYCPCAYDEITRIPAADVAEVRPGEWIPVDEKRDAFDCSECDAMVSRMMNYCPNCGARMIGGNENG